MIVVIGGGWAGLSTAVHLVNNGHKVTLIDSAPNLGGRARTINFQNELVDNGQHLFTGAYKYLLKLLTTLNIKSTEVFATLESKLSFYIDKKCCFSLPLSTKQQTIISSLKNLFSCGLNLTEKFALLKFFYALDKRKITFDANMSVLDLLQKYRQPDSLITKIWQPLTVAALSARLEDASAELFLNVLYATITDTNTVSPLLAKTSLSNILPNPAASWLSHHGCTIKTNTRVEQVIFKQQNIITVKTKQEAILAEQVVVALSPYQVCKLIKDSKLTALSCWQNITYTPIITIYLKYKAPLNLPQAMCGLVNCLGQWVFDRSYSGNKNMLAVVITAVDTLPEKKHLVAQIQYELKKHLGINQQPTAIKLITEKKAVFAGTVSYEHTRPSNSSSITNLWYAGEYTKTGYPACIESAVKSGYTCAERIIEQHL